MKHTIKFNVTMHVEAYDCTKAEHLAMDFLDRITPADGIEFSYNMSPTSGICSHEAPAAPAAPIAAALDQNQVMGLVVEELKRRGIEASHEFPGCIHIQQPNSMLVVGTVNGPYGLDVCELDMNPFEAIESSIDGDSQDVQAIADFIVCHMSAAPCPKCGKRVLLAAPAFEDEGTGAESGRVFRYCSDQCRKAH